MKTVLPYIFFIALALPGCNILGWTHRNEQSHLDRGMELMRQGDYAQAEQEFARAKEENPASADARYYHAKAVQRGAHFDIVDLVKEVSQARTDRCQDGASLPLYNNEIDVLDEIYRVNLIIVNDLRPIYDGETHGSISARDIDIDLAFASLLTALPGLRDTNRDSTINDVDLLLDIRYSSTLEEYYITGFHEFLGGGSQPRSLPINASGVNPEDINPLINYVLDLIEESDDLLIATLQRWTTGTSEENIRNLLEDIRTTIVKYYYDDDRDNDGDAMSDEEQLNGFDDDDDGLIDEDTDHV
ncbi:MAG: hypothetical protein JSV84_12280 [Gemmatimonadota bacterium]|nr:MAG: hypothetical protein JSV84_12280 [Gemmatimonadota bacterium]